MRHGGTDVENNLLGVERCATEICWTRRLATSALRTGIAIHQLCDSKIGDMPHAELLNLLVFEVERLQATRCIQITKKDVERAIDDVLHRAIDERYDKDKDLNRVEPPEDLVPGAPHICIIAETQ